MKRILCLTLLGLLCAAGSATAQPQLQELALTAIAGPQHSIAVQGEIIAVSGFLGLLFFEYDSASQTLTKMSELQWPYMIYQRIKFHPTMPLLYVLDSHHRLFSINLADPQSPSLFLFADSFGTDIWSFDLDSTKLFIFHDGFLSVYDNSNPQGPENLYNSWIGEANVDFIVDNDIMHCMTGFPQLTRYFVLSNTQNPIILDHDDINFGLIGGVGGGHSAIDSYGGLLVYNIASAYPYLIGPWMYSTMGLPAQCCSDGSVYAEGPLGIYKRLDTSWIWLEIGATTSFVIDSNRLYSNSEESSLQAWQLDSSSAISLDSYKFLNNWAQHFAKANNIMAVSGNLNGQISIFDDSNLSEPQYLSEITLPTAATSLSISPPFLYAACGDSVAIIDISDPFAPQLAGLGYFSPPSTAPIYLCASNGKLYVTCFEHITLYDLTDPAYPVLEQDYYESDAQFGRPTLVNQVLAVKTDNTIDLLEAESLNYLSAINLQNSACFICGHDSLLIAGGYLNFQIYSIANPLNASLLYISPLSGSIIWNAAFDGTYLFAAMYLGPNRSLVVFQVFPDRIQLCDSLEIMENSDGEIGIIDSLIYFAQLSCLGIYYYGEPYVAAPPPKAPPLHPTSFILHPSHPNPFNATTVASYEVRVASHVELRVYDTAGRLVSTLVDEWKPAGEHQAIFDGSKLSSGIYLVRLTAGDYNQTQKLVLLK